LALCEPQLGKKVVVCQLSDPLMREARSNRRLALPQSYRAWSVKMETLRVALADWTDFDASAHALAQCLGIMPLHQKMIEEKWVYWSENPLGTMLYSTLERLVELSVLEKREEPDLQYRWCSTYRVANERA
jgi:hypothetical protein